MSEFQDIRIVGIDEHGISRPDDDYDMYYVPFNLSGSPPPDWAEIFAISKPRVSRVSSRRAWLDGSCIVLHAGDDDNFENHKEELESRVEAANAKYREHLADLRKRERREREARQVQKIQESELKRRLSSLDFE